MVPLANVSTPHWISRQPAIEPERDRTLKHVQFTAQNVYHKHVDYRHKSQNMQSELMRLYSNLQHKVLFMADSNFFQKCPYGKIIQV